MKSLLLFALTAGVVSAQSTARVNDAVSPGQVGDAVLSLDEAIRVANGTLAISALSASEQAQIVGSGQVTAIEIDATKTPRITLQADTTPLTGPTPPVAVAVRGVNGKPVLDAAGRSYALHTRTSLVDVTDLTISGGAVGLLGDTMAHMQMGRRVFYGHIDFQGQTQAGARFPSAGMMGMTMATISHSTFKSLDTALIVDDRAENGAIMVDFEYSTIEDVRRGFELFVDGGGTMSMIRTWRSHMLSGDRVADVLRGPASPQRCMLMMIGGNFECSEDAVRADGTDLVEIALHVHHCNIRPGAGKDCFVCGPSTARIDWHVSENVFYGNILIEEGRLNRRLWAWNNVFRDGTFDVSNAGTATNFRWNRFENCHVRALATNRSQHKHQSSEFYDCRVEGLASGFGDVLLENCYLSNTTLSGNAARQTDAPTPWLAMGGADTETPRVGGAVELTLDMPVGMLGIWEIGVADPRLILTQEPWRDYAFRSPLVLLPGIYAFRSTVRIPIPNDPNLVGAEIYCKPTTVPVAGQAHVPNFNLPRGAHLTIQR